MTNDATGSDPPVAINPYAPPEVDLQDADEAPEGGLPEHLGYYRTIVRRFGAALIDFVVLAPLAYLSGDVIHKGGALVGLVGTVLVTLASTAYSVVGHALYGRTVGKKLCRVQVVDLQGALPGWYRAILRDAFPILLNATAVAREVAVFLGMDMSLFLQAAPAQAMAVGIGFWTAVEFVTMLTNKRRRRLHDFLAGTVVIRRG